MAAGIIRLSMDPLHNALPPAEPHAMHLRFPPYSHDPPRLPCEGADADDPSLPRASTVIAEDRTPSLQTIRITEAAQSAAGEKS